MKRYVFMYGDQPWPSGITTLQLYAPVSLESNPELAKLLPQWRAALDGAPVWLVEDEHLHVTLDMVSDAPAGEITSDERQALAASLRQTVAEFPVYQGRAGGCLAYSSGAVVDVSPAEPLRQLHLALRQAIHTARGPDSTGYRVPKAHISIAYANATADSDLYQSRLRQIDPNGAPLQLTEVQLVEAGADQTTGQLRWTTVESFPLSPSPPPKSEHPQGMPR